MNALLAALILLAEDPADFCVPGATDAVRPDTLHPDPTPPPIPSVHPPTPSGAWMLLYAIEAAAITGVLRRYKDDTRAAAGTVGRAGAGRAAC